MRAENIVDSETALADFAGTVEMIFEASGLSSGERGDKENVYSKVEPGGSAIDYVLNVSGKRFEVALSPRNDGKSFKEIIKRVINVSAGSSLVVVHDGGLSDSDLVTLRNVCDMSGIRLMDVEKELASWVGAEIPRKGKGGKSRAGKNAAPSSGTCAEVACALLLIDDGVAKSVDYQGRTFDRATVDALPEGWRETMTQTDGKVRAGKLCREIMGADWVPGGGKKKGKADMVATLSAPGNVRMGVSCKSFLSGNPSLLNYSGRTVMEVNEATREARCLSNSFEQRLNGMREHGLRDFSNIVLEWRESGGAPKGVGEFGWYFANKCTPTESTDGAEVLAFVLEVEGTLKLVFGGLDVAKDVVVAASVLSAGSSKRALNKEIRSKMSRGKGAVAIPVCIRMDKGRALRSMREKGLC